MMAWNPASDAVRPRRGRSLPRRRRAVVYFLEFTVCCALLGGFGYAFSSYVYESDRFMVKWVRISGLEVLPEEEVRQVAGIHENDNVLLADCEAIRRRVEAMPYVKQAEVQRLYPDTIFISLTERKPVLVLLLNNRLYEVDENAIVLRQLDGLANDSVPLVSGLAELSTVEPGQKLEPPALLEVIKLWNAFRQTPLAGEFKVSEFAAAAPNDITMICENVPFVFRWGRTDYLQQAQLLDVWWREIGHSNPCHEYVDLRFGNDFVCK